MSTILHISDTHFGTEVGPVVDAVVRLHDKFLPELVLLSGDVTQRARRYQFQRATRFVERLVPRAFLVLPGNHDIPLFDLWSRWRAPYDNYQRAFGSALEPVFESDELLVLGVNTTRPERLEDGEISEEQVERVSERLRAARPEQLALVVTHQPVLAIERKDKKNLVHGRDAAVHAWSEAGADAILGGHIHLPYVRPLRARFPDLARETWAIQAGTAVSHRVRGNVPNSVNLVHFASSERSCRVERWDYEATSGEFELFETTELRIEPRREPAPPLS